MKAGWRVQSLLMARSEKGNGLLSLQLQVTQQVGEGSLSSLRFQLPSQPPPPRALCRLPPASIVPVLRTPVLYAEDNGIAGQALGLAFQLLDADGRSFVATEGLSVLPVVQHQGGGRAVLLACSMEPDLAGSGIGNCLGTVPASLFPGPGSTSTASVTLTAYIG